VPGAIVSYRVADFSAFVRVFEQNTAMREAAGMSFVILCQAASDPNHVFIFVEGDDLAKLRAFDKSVGFEDMLKVAGVITPPQIQFLDKIHHLPQ
jgi:hypothetical protein